MVKKIRIMITFERQSGPGRGVRELAGVIYMFF